MAEDLIGIIEVGEDLDPQVSQGHTHLNKTVLDAITAPFTLANELYLETTVPERFKGSFAEIYFDNGTTLQSIPNGNDYTKITGFMVNGESYKCTADKANNQIIIGETGYYRLSSVFSTYLSGSNNITFHTVVFKNGVRLPTPHVVRKFGNATDISTGGASVIVYCNVGDILDARCMHNALAPVNINVVYASINVSRIGY